MTSEAAHEFWHIVGLGYGLAFVGVYALGIVRRLFS